MQRGWAVDTARERVESLLSGRTSCAPSCCLGGVFLPLAITSVSNDVKDVPAPGSVMTMRSWLTPL